MSEQNGKTIPSFVAREQRQKGSDDMKQTMLDVIDKQMSLVAQERNGYLLEAFEDHQLLEVRRFIASFHLTHSVGGEP